eukprot:5943546-Pyramimonas_sp.AAC.1
MFFCLAPSRPGGHLAESSPHLVFTPPESTSLRAPSGSLGASGLSQDSGPRPARHRDASSSRACRGACASSRGRASPPASSCARAKGNPSCPPA